MSRLQRAVYHGLIQLLTPVGLALGRKQDPVRWRERLGYYPSQLPQAPLWIHAASVGEAKAAALLIDALRDAGEPGPFVVTTTTRTGGDTIRAVLRPGDMQLYAPLDNPRAVNRALAQIAPRALVVMEVEIWPNLWSACKARAIPVVLANARLSDSSLARYQNKLPAVWSHTLQQADMILAQSDTIAARFRALGVNDARLQVSGNLKFSLSIDSAVQTAGERLRQLLGSERPVWLAASTHPGEEAIALDTQRQLLAKHPELLLVLVPRHPQRFNEVAQQCAASGLRWQRRSDDGNTPVAADCQVYLADTLGELLALYCAADLCWVAGSFVDVGGHNILEPAACNCPMIVGPDMRNFEAITAEFLAAKALHQVTTPDALKHAIASLLMQPQSRRELSQQAAMQLQGYANAASQQADAIRALLG
ncbi:3-deoxy-D-manno-octulosonic acid transferase [Motiliproteus sediminis]|uniref:3-deoxy-D-manno-octulosonic acid transferase n=1 Tax=Motiliproteus sediminis TaxID=1468178 RepID=UPI001AEFDF45|nr:3-deoxy-D-manno-octulosonic acid transferase [Motiliproteus sediminis]